MNLPRVLLPCLFVVVCSLVGCGIANQIADGTAHSTAASEAIGRQLGSKPQISFSYFNGTLAQVTVTFAEPPALPVRQVEAIARAAIVKEFNAEPDTLVVAFAVAKGQAIATIPETPAGATGPLPPPDLPVPPTIEAQLGGSVEQMLDRADAFKIEGTEGTDRGRHLVSPAGQNAAELYRQVLKSQPGDARASKGLQDIAAFYTNIAQKACGQQQYESCGMIADDGLVAAPDDAALLHLRQQAAAAGKGTSASAQ